MKQQFTIEIIYPTAREQELITVEVELGQTIQWAIKQSGILEKYTEIDLRKNPVGIFGKRKALSDTLQPQDRIEIYRPLQIDPKQARMLRAKKKAN